MSEKDFLVTSVGAELPRFTKPTYIIFLPDQKLLENENIKSALKKFAPLVHAGEPQIKFETIDFEKLQSSELELTCMDAREFSPISREKLLGQNFLTFAGSGFFLHPEIAQKLKENGQSDLVEALTAILQTAQAKGLKINIISNHFGEDCGCGGLNFIKNNCGGLEIPNARAYKKLLEETRNAIGEIAAGAKLAIYQTGQDGTIQKSFDLENEADFAAFDQAYQGKF